MLVDHLKLFLNHPTTTRWENLDVVTMEFYFIPIKQELFQTKLNALLQLSGKISMLSSVGQASIARFCTNFAKVTMV